MSHRVVIREAIHRELAGHLLSGFAEGPWQEETCLALWHRGDGLDRYTGIVNKVLLPEDDDRDLHGNVTVRGRYLNRAVDQAVQSEAGVAVLHSHPASGWQAMSGMDDRTERRIIAPLVRETGLPLLGLTMGMDECWSARFWQEPELGRIVPAHCTDVRRVGTRHSRADWAPEAYPTYNRRRRLRRTLDSWGIEAQARLARTHVCVVGAGSVGSIVLESIARIGVERITIIEPDEVEEHNLDRLIYADGRCVGLRKADVTAARVRRVATAANVAVRAVPLSIRTERAYRAAADADVIVCCVDNAEARDVLNHLAYSNCLPIIDGGVNVESTDRLLSAKWRVHLAGPGMRCLRCRRQYAGSEARDERAGIRRGGRYIDPGDDVDSNDNGPEPGQNTMVFCNAVAADEVRMLVRYLVGEDWWHDDGARTGRWSVEHRFVGAETEAFEHPGKCAGSCEFSARRLGRGRLGRPTYGFLEAEREGWRARLRRWKRRCGARAARVVDAIAG